MGAATTGDGEGTGEEKELDWHPPHVRSSPTFQSWLRLWPYRVHEMQRCGLLLGLPTFRGLSVCLCICWSQPRAVLKRLNRSRCRSGCDSWGPEEACSGRARIPPGRGTFGAQTWACRDLSTVVILNFIREGARAMRRLATSLCCLKLDSLLI